MFCVVCGRPGDPYEYCTDEVRFSYSLCREHREWELEALRSVEEAIRWVRRRLEADRWKRSARRSGSWRSGPGLRGTGAPSTSTAAGEGEGGRLRIRRHCR